MAQANSGGGLPSITAWWGKLGSAGGAQGYHPLICHMMDVAVVALEMWDGVLSPAAKRALRVGLGMEDERAARTWVGLLAGLHDVGKLCPAFELRDGAEELAHLYKSMPPKPLGLGASDAPHGVVTASELVGILAQKGVDRTVAKLLSIVIGGHHGTFPRADERRRARERGGAGGNRWQQERTRQVEVLAEVLETPWGTPPSSLDNATAMTLAGLVSVADWIASDKTFFDYAAPTRSAAPDLDLWQYRVTAERVAKEVLGDKHLAWSGWTPGPSHQSFRELFAGRIEHPNSLQLTVEAVAEQIRDEIGLVVIEAPMGEGKTEAAFFLADSWGVEPGPRGMYVALPTQATSNQMLARAKDFLERRYRSQVVNLMLLHGQATLSTQLEELLHPLAMEDDGQAEAARVRATQWFTKSKRGLLAPFGVGTVDQALLAGLQTRHVFVRLFGLAHKVVIIDEVHAYDAYMSELLEGLLAWLGALGSPVILLSATLPGTRRDALIRAYATGTGMRIEQFPEHVRQCGYPRLTWVIPSTGNVDAVPVGASDRGNRRLALQWLGGGVETAAGAFELGDMLKEAMADGGCAAVICNTVRRAQDVYMALQRCFLDLAEDQRPELGLFHARFLYDERDRRERRAVAQYGKLAGVAQAENSGAEAAAPEESRPKRAVLVATQVIEQSLDLDFDLMVSDFAPVDLLLQRSGRLHRHQRGVGESERPARVRRPVLWICQPQENDGVPAFTPGDKAVYDEHILLRTWLALGGRDHIDVPDEVEALVEAVYDDNVACPIDANEAVVHMWVSTGQNLQKRRDKLRGLARNSKILGPGENIEDVLEDWNMKLEEEAPEVNPQLQALTRVEELPSVSCVLLDRAETEAIHLGRPPDRDATRRLLGRSVRLAGRGIAPVIIAAAPPRGWQRSALLRNHRLLPLDEGGVFRLDGYTVGLDQELGVVIERATRG